MRLVIEAMGYTDYPEQLKSVELSSEDLALSKEEKLRRAVDVVHNKGYVAQKMVLRGCIKTSLNNLERMAYKGDVDELSSLRAEYCMYHYSASDSGDILYDVADLPSWHTSCSQCGGAH